MSNEQAPESCPFCGAVKTNGVTLISGGPRYECGTYAVYGPEKNVRDFQSPRCATTERERLIRERDEAKKAAETAMVELGQVASSQRDLLSRVKQLESDWSGWPELQREWFGGKYAAMQPLEAVRARIEDSEARVQRLEEALEGCAAIIGPRDKVTWATDEQVDHAWELYTKAKEAKP